MMDPVKLAVLKGRLEQIADEMDATLYRSAFNPIIAEAHDASHGLYDASTGDTLVQGKSGLPVFVGAMAFAVRAAIDAARADGGLRDGDVWIFNDPYDGGTHLNDFKLVRPFFYDGRLFCCLASVAHWHDVGGAVPGNYNPAATECWQEGILIPPVRLVREGQTVPEVLTILQANSRLPGSVYGDLNGQLAALELGERRLTALLEEYGADTVRDALHALRERAVMMMHRHIRELPEGDFRCEDFLDNDGITDTPLRIAVRLGVDHGGDNRPPSLALDFSGTSAACAGPVNISRSTAIAACYVALKHCFADVPANAGVLDAITFTIADDSLISARKPAPVGGYTETILRMIDVIFGALAKADPARATAMAYGTINALSIAGTRSEGPDAGRPWVMFSFFGGGHGGHPDGDGLSHGNAPISMATIPPLEILEASYPVAFTQWALRPDSAGDGEHRGGLGAIYEIELLEKDARAFVFGERGRFAPKGVVGGGEAACNEIGFAVGDRWQTPPMVSKQVGVSLTRGDRVRIATPGGGGWGDPARRSPAARERDRRLGYTGAADAAPETHGETP
ncbi:MAG: hydantoinase B/oxoprolinase family protein [Burkholderiaceae bacterium]